MGVCTVCSVCTLQHILGIVHSLHTKMKPRIHPCPQYDKLINTCNNNNTVLLCGYISSMEISSHRKLIFIALNFGS